MVARNKIYINKTDVFKLKIAFERRELATVKVTLYQTLQHFNRIFILFYIEYL